MKENETAGDEWLLGRKRGSTNICVKKDSEWIEIEDNDVGKKKFVELPIGKIPSGGIQVWIILAKYPYSGWNGKIKQGGYIYSMLGGFYKVDGCFVDPVSGRNLSWSFMAVFFTPVRNAIVGILSTPT